MTNCRSAAAATVISCAAQSPSPSPRKRATATSSLWRFMVLRSCDRVLFPRSEINWFNADRSDLSIRLESHHHEAEQGGLAAREEPGSLRERSFYTRRIMTSVDLMRAAAT